MKKNRGFTLIELLAAMVILGLLMAIALPTILGLFSKNTNKVYVNDALKLVSQAEYKIRAASTTVERPDDGDCIIMSLKYLDNGDFDEAPNKGEYDDNKSFVVIKNTGNDLEYSVTLVENVKGGGYRGVKLTLASKLNKSDAVKYVVDFKDSDLVSVADDEKMYPQYATGINNTDLGSNYVNGVLKVYDKNGLRDNTTATDSLAPKIVKASISSASNKDFNSLDAKLSLTVSDKDTEFNMLKVKYKIYYDGETGNYPEINSSCSSSADSTISGCFDWGTKEATFSKNFDFSSKLSYTDENKSTLKMYLIVYDPDGNYDSRIISYSIHKNRAPVIKNFSVGSMNSSYNISKARVRIDITDDIDDVSSLKYCLTEDKNNGCKKDSEFKLYKTDANGFIPYTFMCNNSACLPNGTTKELHLYVKDTAGLVSKEDTTYVLYKNHPPHLDEKYSTITLIPNWQKYGYKDSNQKVLLDSLDFKIDSSMIVDDLTEHDNIRVRLQEVDQSHQNVVTGGQNFDNKNSSDKTYTLAELGSVMFKFSGDYLTDKNRYLKATFIDEQGASTVLYVDYNNLYKNSRPTINEFTVKSKGAACDNCNTSLGGSLNTSITMKLSDDIDDESQLQYRICTIYNSKENCGQYAYYDPKNQTIDYTIKSLSDYIAGNSSTNVKIKLQVKDTDQAVSEESVDYKLYPNLPPTINVKSVKTRDSYYNTNDVEVIFTVKDDFNASSGKYRVCTMEKGSSGSYDCTSYYSLSNKYNQDISTIIQTIPDTMGTGKVYNVRIEASDGVSTTTSDKEYKIYNDTDPYIQSFAVTEQSYTANNIKFKLKFSVKDPFDTYSICVSESKSSCSGGYSGSYEGGYVIDGIYVKNKSGALLYGEKSGVDVKFTKTYAESDSVQVYLHVKDSHGKTAVKGAVYDACYVNNEGADTVSGVYGKVVNSYKFNDDVSDPGVKINRKNCGGNCYYISNDYLRDSNGKILTDSDENKLTELDGDESLTTHARNILKSLSGETSDIYGAYSLTSTYYSKKVTGKVCLTRRDNAVSLNCSYYRCFLNANSEMSSKVIGVYWNKKASYTQEIGGKTYTCRGYYKGYTSSRDSDSKKVNLTPNGKEYCDTAVEKENGPYSFKSSADNPYIRGNDYATPKDE